MYAYESSQFNSGMLVRYLTAHMPEIGKAIGLAVVLADRINWKRDADDFGPRGTINHLTVRKMAEALRCSQSTVQEHLAILRAAGIIESEPVTDRHGAISYCRLWFSGFVLWLKRRDVKPTESWGDVSKSTPSGHSEGGGSEKSDPNHNIRNHKLIDLDHVISIRFSSLESVIREAKPKLANGQSADSQMVFERFRSFNLRKGISRISLAALRGFAKNFTEFRPNGAEKRMSKPETILRNLPETPIGPTTPADLEMKKTLKAMQPELFDAWFANLSFSREDNKVRVKAPSTFIKSYVSSHYEKLIRDVAGPGSQIIFV